MAQPDPCPEARQVDGAFSRFFIAGRFLGIGLILALMAFSGFALAQTSDKKAPPATTGAKTIGAAKSSGTSSNLNTGPQVKPKDSIQTIPTIQPRVPIKPRI